MVSFLWACSVVFDGCRTVAVSVCLCGTHDQSREDRAAGAVSVLRRSVFTDRISVYRGTVLRWKCRDYRAAACDDTQSGRGVAGIDHCVLRTGSGPAGERDALVRLSGATFVQYILCLPDPSGTDGRISEYPAVLPTPWESAFEKRTIGEDPISWISDTDDHPGILSADAQYGETLKNNSGSPGVTWVPLFCTRPQDKEDEACNAESDPGGYHLCMHFRGMGGRKYDTVCGNIVWEYGQGEDWQYED